MKELGLRHRLLVLFALGCTGLLAELWLIGHHEDLIQRLPLFLLALGLVSSLWALAGRGSWRLRWFELLSAGLVALGATGLWKHYQSNLASALEPAPDLTGTELVRQALAGEIPVLAPGAVIFLGLLGLLYGHRHPEIEALTEATSDPEPRDPS